MKFLEMHTSSPPRKGPEANWQAQCILCQPRRRVPRAGEPRTAGKCSLSLSYLLQAPRFTVCSEIG